MHKLLEAKGTSRTAGERRIYNYLIQGRFELTEVKRIEARIMRRPLLALREEI